MLSLCDNLCIVRWNALILLGIGHLRSAAFSHDQSAALDENLAAICWKTLQSGWKPSSIPYDVRDSHKIELL